ncbi:l-threonine synthase [Anopheles sinensis]|uniref:L-threonine synthase n=1 Tax=Anopheles sinensis TaxID=74873 RepID=A0A084VJS0_ANOSI|nr:l-threonine synthase [Anopheles sinensis]
MPFEGTHIDICIGAFSRTGLDKNKAEKCWKNRIDLFHDPSSSGNKHKLLHSSHTTPYYYRRGHSTPTETLSTLLCDREENAKDFWPATATHLSGLRRLAQAFHVKRLENTFESKTLDHQQRKVIRNQFAYENGRQFLDTLQSQKRVLC